MRLVFPKKLLLVTLTALAALSPLFLAPAFRGADTLPAQLTDEQLWSMVAKTGFSEDCGIFRSENYLSNEISFQNVVAPLKAAAKTGNVYMGVGPEQNFTYIVALQPKMAFIVDVRCGNMREHMMYKALFEMSDNRADFLSRLFSRKRPAGLTDKSTTDELFAAFSVVQPDQMLFEKNLMDIEDLLTKTHKFGLSADDLDGIDTIYGVFFRYGPAINYSATPYGGGGPGRGGGNMPNYADLMTATDQEGKNAVGVNRSFLGSEENFKIIRDLEKKNLIVPLVDNFAGPKAIRSVGKYLKDHNAIVSAFYLSNVEQYLFTDGIADMFYNNVKTLPLDASSTFLRSGRPGGQFGGGIGGGLVSMLSSMQDVLRAFDAGHLRQWNDVIDLSKVP
jgi:hypothetical protein